MAENSDTPPSAPDFATQIAALTTQVQENANKFLALEDENATLRRENHNFSERFSTVKTTSRPELCFQVPIINMQPLVTPKLGNSSSQPLGGSPAIHSISLPVTFESLPFITTSTVETTLLHAIFAWMNALNTAPH